MGAYLETPVREKVSEDKCDDRLSYGASSMQGWRISQEDAHTCLLDFDADTKTSMFAVYDGHGGAEVAEYTASHLPDFLKTLDQYKSGKLGQALEDGFLGFDATLVNEEVVTVLKDLAQTEPDEEENEEEQAQETAMLFEEASMPLEKLLERYSSGGQNKAMKALRKKEEFQSPAIKAKKDQNENNAADSNDGDKDQETLQMDEIKIKLDKQLTNGDSSEAVAQESDTDTKCQKVKNDTDADNDVTHSIDSTTNEETDNNKDISERKITTPSAESSSSSVNGAIKVESPGEVSSSTEAQSTSTGSAGSASNVSCSGEAPNASSSIGDSAKSTVELSPSSSTDARSAGAGPGGSVSTSSSGSGIGSTSCNSSGAGSSDCTSASSSVVAGSSDSTSCSSSGAGGSSSTSASSSAAGSGGTGACSSAGGSGSAGASSMPGGSGSSQQDPVAGSSSGRTRKPRKNVIPGEDEDETSCSDDDDDDDEDDEDDWETSEEEEDIDNLVQPDSEDDDMIEDAPCVHAHAHDDDEEEDTFMTAGEEPGMDSGCTAVVALVRNKELFVANAGDSRCVLCRAGKAVDMSVDHKPEDEIERNRIRKAGGKITMDGRVNGGLNLSRAIGDHSYKQKKALSDREQMITALPDIRTMTLDETDEFMVLACDGIWNVMSSQDVVTFVRERLNAGRNKLSQICEEMFDFCLAPDTMGDGTGCDNMTCVIVTFKDGLKSQEGHDRGEKRPADGSSDGDVKEPQTKRQKADDD